MKKNKAIRNVSFFAILLLARCASAQFSVEAFTEDNGLSSGKINTHLVDSTGKIWLGTSWGVCVYNGKSWTSITSIDDVEKGGSIDLGDVRMIREDKSHKMWLGAEEKFFIYTGKYWIHYQDQALEGYSARYIFQDSRGNMWVCFEDLEDRPEVAVYLSFQIVSGLVTRFSGDIWINFGDNAGGSYAVKSGEETIYYSGLLEDGLGNIWIATVDGLYRFDGKTWTEYLENSITSSFVTSIQEANDGSIWASTRGGVSRIEGDQVTNYTRNDGLGGNDVRDLYIDSDGNIWAYIGGNFQFNGYAMFDGKKWNFYDSHDGLPPGKVFRLQDDGTGTVWALSRSGISFFRDGKWKEIKRKDGLHGRKFYAIAFAKNHSIWVGSDEGIFEFSGESWEMRYRDDKDERNCEVNIFYEDVDGRMLAGTKKSGVIIFDGENALKMDASSGLAGKEVRDMFSDSHGDTWVVTNEGINRLYPGRSR